MHTVDDEKEKLPEISIEYRDKSKTYEVTVGGHYIASPGRFETAQLVCFIMGAPVWMVDDLVRSLDMERFRLETLYPGYVYPNMKPTQRITRDQYEEYLSGPWEKIREYVSERGSG